MKRVKSFNQIEKGSRIMTVGSKPRRAIITEEPEKYRDRSNRLTNSYVPVRFDSGAFGNVAVDRMMVYTWDRKLKRFV